ncbi:MAG: type II secretion system protein [Planctomycetes bacterium]|nr:type II secretion system protein [Planctomycetota bacterium]
MAAPARRTTASGFTLFEVLIVITVIAILTSTAIPNMLASRTTANETVAVAALRSIIAAQLQCQSPCLVDRDGDGRGEALDLDELCGTHALRSSAPALTPSPLPQSLGRLNNLGHVAGRGYLLCLYLPDATGSGIAATPANSDAVDTDLAETYWTNQTGEILRTAGGRYDGRTLVPEAGAALVGSTPNSLVQGKPAANTLACDGNRWVTVQ